jgi:DNA-binding PadR family transcriptional regulator
MAKLSELEGAVLGLVHDMGPATPYAIRRVFLDSPAPQWSGSAGAIYPLFRRLERRGLVRSEASATGRRASRLYTLTPEGLRGLRGWLVPLPHEAVGVPMDPLRTRLRFLGALPAGQRAGFLTEARQRLREHLRVVREDCLRRRRGGDRYDYLMARGALLAVRARLAWLKEVSAALSR